MLSVWLHLAEMNIIFVLSKSQEEQSEEATAAEPTTEEKPAEGDAEPEAVAVGADTAEKSEAQPTGHTAVEDSVPSMSTPCTLRRVASV